MKALEKIIYTVISGIFLLTFNCSLFTDKTADKFDEKEKKETKIYAVGDTGPSGVGKVFYITDGGLHGLEVAPENQSTGTAWITGGATQNTANGNTLTGIGSGLANSNAIIAQTDHTGSAAKLCRDYTGGGRTDWFLPSKDELYQVYIQRDLIGLKYDVNFYWSSSEYTTPASSAWSMPFVNGTYGSASKSSTFIYARAVRAF